MKYFKIIRIIGLLFIVLIPIFATGQNVEIRLRIHPQSKTMECSELFGATSTDDEIKELSLEPDYKILLKRGWIRLEGYDYIQKRQFYPCFQDIVVVFPTLSSFHTFSKEMTSCPQYPFYSGADYALQTAIFENAVLTGDIDLYIILLSKDGRSASEMNPPLYSILRKNPEALLTAFSNLNTEQKQIAIATQYDFNLGLQDQIITEQQIEKLPKLLKQTAQEFNEMMLNEADQ